MGLKFGVISMNDILYNWDKWETEKHSNSKKKREILLHISIGNHPLKKQWLTYLWTQKKGTEHSLLFLYNLIYNEDSASLPLW